MNVSPELQKWLKEREELIKSSRRMSKKGIKILLTPELHNPEFVKEPLKSEALEYFKHNPDKLSLEHLTL